MDEWPKLRSRACSADATAGEEDFAHLGFVLLGASVVDSRVLRGVPLKGARAATA